MVEHFTEQASSVLAVAQDEAGSFGAECIGVEHILLALAGEDGGLAAVALRSFDISQASMRECLARKPSSSTPSDHGVPQAFTRPAKLVLERSLRVAQDLRDSYIGPEHILLALLAGIDSARSDEAANQLLCSVDLVALDELISCLRTRERARDSDAEEGRNNESHE